MSKLKKWVGYWVRDPLWGAIDFLTFSGLRCLSLQGASDTGARLGSLARHRFVEANDNVLANLRILRPHSTEVEIESLALQMWQNIGRTLTEMAVLDRFDFTRDTSIVNLDTFNQLDRSRPVIFLYPHLGNWELLARYAVSRGYRLNIIYELLPNRFQRQLLETARRRSGYELIAPDFQGTKRLYQALAEGESIGMAIDEFKRGRIVSSLFSGTPGARTNIRYAIQLARKYRATLVCTYCLRRDTHAFELVCGEVIDLLIPPYQHMNDDMLAAKISAVCNQWVLAHPEQWYMLHRARLII